MERGEFITSDTHFSHANVIRYSKRPFLSADEMDIELIKRWNAKVPKDAVVYHLGDFAFSRPDRLRWIVGSLNGRIRLVRGNHDARAIKGGIVDLFEWVKDYHETKMHDGTKVVMCHYAMLVWNKSHYGSWMLHGHSHGTLRDAGIFRIDVGIDTNPNYEPYSFDEISQRMAGRSIHVVDHHGSER